MYEDYLSKAINMYKVIKCSFRQLLHHILSTFSASLCLTVHQWHKRYWDNQLDSELTQDLLHRRYFSTSSIESLQRPMATNVIAWGATIFSFSHVDVLSDCVSKDLTYAYTLAFGSSSTFDHRTCKEQKLMNGVIAGQIFEKK